jgi:hypothetical protein
MDSLIIYTRKTFKEIPSNKFYINRRTDVGEDAEFYERKPYGGKRLIPQNELVGSIRKGEFSPFNWVSQELVEKYLGELYA